MEVELVDFVKLGRLVRDERRGGELLDGP